MPLDEIARIATYLSAASGFLIGAVTAAFSWFEKAREIRGAISERRRNEIHRLKQEFDKLSPTFSRIFDYTSQADAHLRIDNLGFNSKEVKTRFEVDTAFEFLRDMHTSVRLGLIKKIDITLWCYWIHRVETRDALKRYARACGYYSFLKDLIAWTAASSELRELEQHCPWWGSDKRRSRGGPSGTRNQGLRRIRLTK